MSAPDQPPTFTRSRTLPTLVGWFAMLGGAVGVVLVVRSFGATLSPPPAPVLTASPAVAAHPALLGEVLLALAVVTLVAHLFGAVFERVLEQPPVMGEIVAGIVLGPSVLGALSPSTAALLLPTSVAPYLGIVAKLGVVLFMFLVGLELNPRLLRENTHATIVIAHASIVVPFALGSTLALALYPVYSHAGADFTVFALFLGVSMSVTAFPVLARILTDRRLHSTPLGVIAIACAAVDDATAWCLLAFVSGIASAQLGSTGLTFALLGAYLAVMVLVVRPFAGQLARHAEKQTGPISHGTLAVVLGALLLSAAATERIGIHALFGAFLFGAVLPHEGRLSEQLRARLEDVVVVLLLPVFFAFTGLRTQVGLVSSPRDWLLTVAVLGVATIGKFGGTFLAARFSGLDLRASAALGILMNTRGLMELIVLNVGLDLGILSPTLFTMLVFMAVTTTFMTSPLLSVVLSGSEPTPDAGGEHAVTG